MMQGTPMASEPLELWETSQDNSGQSSSVDGTALFSGNDGYSMTGTVGHIQYLEVQATDTQTGSATTEANKKQMLISHKGGQQYHPKVNTNGTVDREYYFETRFPKGNKGNSHFAILRGRYSQATCRIDLNPTHIWSGVPEHFLGRRSSIQLDYRERMKTVDQDANQVKKLRNNVRTCLLYTSTSPRDGLLSRMPSSA